MTVPTRVSILVPAYNEAESLPALAEAILKAFEGNGLLLHELVLIDDGSTDHTWAEACRLAATRPELRLRAFRFRRNFGKAAALDLGFRIVSGTVVVTMDADLQDDPNEIRTMVSKLEEGYDLVSGWKKRRHDPLEKTLPSRIFNATVSHFTKLKLHDFNCGLKTYRLPAAKQLRLYGELHRFIPALAHAQGFRVTEIAVTHHARKFGVSKYGWKRYLRGFLDLLTVVATTQYLARPAHLFGGMGVALSTVGLGTLAYLTVEWFLGHGPIGNRPLLTLGMLCVLAGMQMLCFGLLAELLVRRVGDSDPRSLVMEETSNPLVAS
jgi:glycosyltransferase involved in cell wall biosynthesis